MRASIAFLLMTLLSVNVFADEAAKQRLISRLETYSTLTADFEQRTYQEDQRSGDVSVGKLSVAKPLKFSWLVNEPFEQQVISDGETIWVFDPDLEQATYQAVDESLTQSPAMILAQPRTALENQYDVTEAGNDSLTVYRLYPKQEESVFVELLMIFENDVINELRIKDTLAQETVISLSNVIENRSIDASTFIFEAPPGTDLFEQM